MKKGTALVLVLCLLVQCTRYLAVIGFYELNKGYIAKNLCENRDKPALKCCGKCYLRKQLKKASDSGKDGPLKTEKQEVALVYLLPAPIRCCVSSRPALDRPFNPRGQHLFGCLFLHAVFRPPSAA